MKQYITLLLLVSSVVRGDILPRAAEAVVTLTSTVYLTTSTEHSTTTTSTTVVNALTPGFKCTTSVKGSNARRDEHARAKTTTIVKTVTSATSTYTPSVVKTVAGFFAQESGGNAFTNGRYATNLYGFQVPGNPHADSVPFDAPSPPVNDFGDGLANLFNLDSQCRLVSHYTPPGTFRYYGNANGSTPYNNKYIYPSQDSSQTRPNAPVKCAVDLSTYIMYCHVGSNTVSYTCTYIPDEGFYGLWLIGNEKDVNNDGGCLPITIIAVPGYS